MRVEQMPVYRLFYDMALSVETTTRTLGPDFRWLRVQALRSSESVCANLTEGFYAQYSTEYLQCLYRSGREARETGSHIQYACDIGQLKMSVAEDLLKGYEQAHRQLSHLIASIERKIQEQGKAKPGIPHLRDIQEDYTSESEDPAL